MAAAGAGHWMSTPPISASIPPSQIFNLPEKPIVRSALKTPFSGLLKALKAEKSKIEKIKPAGYYIYTSAGLSPANKEKIFDIFYPFLKSREHIYSIDDISNGIKNSESLEKKHFKLWMGSSGLIFDLINSGVINRSTLLAEEIISSERMFVRTRAAAKAEDLLTRRGSVILTGEPGAGKTTLAKHLCGWSAADGYNVIDISCPEDAHKMWKKGGVDFPRPGR